MATQDDQIDLQFNKYRASNIDSTYSRDEGLLVIPVMGPAGTAPTIVRVHAPYGTRSEEFTYIKQGTPPLFPSMEDTISGDIFLGHAIRVPVPITDQQNNLVFGIIGRYDYVQPEGGRTQGDTFPLDAHPFPTKIDGLGQSAPEITDPTILKAMGQWTQQGIDTGILTASKIIG